MTTERVTFPKNYKLFKYRPKVESRTNDMIQTNEYELFTTTKDYLNVVKNWMKRAGVQSGFELGYREDQNPNSTLHHKNWFNMGDALVTTGFCVSVSNAIFNSDVVQKLLNYLCAKAKFISIDIK